MWGCIVERHIVVHRFCVYLCILHCCMAIGRWLVCIVEAGLESLPKETAEAVQRLFYPACTGVNQGATAAPDGEEARALSLAWEEMSPLLAYAPEDVERQAVVARRIYFGTCTETSPLSVTPERLLSRGSALHTAARPPASPTTSSTWRRM